MEGRCSLNHFLQYVTAAVLVIFTFSPALTTADLPAPRAPNPTDPGTIVIEVELPDAYQIYQANLEGYTVEIPGKVVYEVVPPGQVALTVNTGDWPCFVSPEIIDVSATGQEWFDVMVDPHEFNGTQSRTLTVKGEYVNEETALPSPIKIDDYTGKLTVHIRGQEHYPGKAAQHSGTSGNDTSEDLTHAMIITAGLSFAILTIIVVALAVRRWESNKKEKEAGRTEEELVVETMEKMR